ncbi:mono-functional DNA-alkylating methyl methanesulfonate N-term-domain-containing protein [Entophlyctis helioformis]|nr:mono-functional DNA-alkylating methyl methanesulfonate N-term-domain-containing protein [Entophlyctis helioformis]
MHDDGQMSDGQMGEGQMSEGSQQAFVYVGESLVGGSGLVRSCLRLRPLHAGAGSGLDAARPDEQAPPLVLQVKDSALDVCVLAGCSGLDAAPQCVAVASEHVFGRILATAILRHRQLPHSDLIVCTSDSGLLSVLACEQLQGDSSQPQQPQQPQFALTRFFEMSIAAPGMLYTDLGHLVAADPSGRCIAVAAFQDQICVWPVDQHCISDPDRPLMTRRDGHRLAHNQSGMIILKMAFLHPSPATPDLVHLVVVFCKNRAFSIAVFEWDASNDSIVPRLSEPFPLEPGSMPLHLVALPSLKDHFLLITESDLLLFKASENKFGAAIQARQKIPGPFHSTDIPQDLGHLGALISSVDILDASGSGQDHLYLASDQGDVLYARIMAFPKTMHVMHVLSRRHPISCISVSSVSPNRHTLAFFGPLHAAELVQIDPRTLAVESAIQPSPALNAAPAVDFCLHDMQGQGRDTMYMTSGVAPFGSICEMQHGVGVVTDMSSPEFEGVTGMWEVAVSPDEDSSVFVVISFVSETRIMLMSGGELDDISETSGLVTEASTLCAGSAGVAGLVAQAHSSGIRVSKPRQDGTSPSLVYSWSDPDGRRVALATFHRSDAVVVLAGTNSLLRLRMLVDEESGAISIVRTAGILLQAEPSYLYCSSQDVAVEQCTRPSICIVGTYDAQLFVYSLDPQDGQLRPMFTVPLLQYSSDAIMIPHSIHLLESDQHMSESPHLLIGLRDGCLLDFAVSWYHDLPALGLSDTPSSQDDPMMPASLHLAIQPRVIRLGVAPVMLVASHNGHRARTSPDYLLALAGGSPWRLCMSDLGGIRIEQLLYGQVEHALRFAYDGGAGDEYLFVTADTLQIVRVDDHARYHMRSIPITETPRRVVVDPVTKLLVVTTTTRTGDAESSSIMVVNPVTAKILLTETLPDHETIHSLEVWHIKHNKRYLCVGTRRNENQGRVLVYGLRKHELKPGRIYTTERPPYKLPLLGERTVNGPVLALCSFVNSYLLCSAGTVLYQIKIEAATRTVITGAHIDTRSLITRIRSNGTRAIVSNQRDSTSVYNFSLLTKTFSFVTSDSLSRAGSDDLPIGGALILGTDKLGTIFGLAGGPYADPAMSTEHLVPQSMQTEFCFSMSEPVLRIQAGSMSYRAASLIEPSSRSLDRQSHGLAAATVTESSQLDRGWWPEGSTGSTGSIGSHTRQLLAHTAKKVDAVDAVSVPLQVTSAKRTKEPSAADAGEPPSIDRRAEGGQVVYGVTLSGGLVSMIRLRSDVYFALMLLQSAMNADASTNPLLGNDLVAYRSQLFPMKHAIDGQFVQRFLGLDGAARERLMAEWETARKRDLLPTERRGLCRTAMTDDAMDRLLVWLRRSCV